MEAGRKDVDPAIRADGLSKTFRHVRALEDLSLDIPTGATYFLLGPNGSGKTTFIRLLAGVLRRTRGTIRVLGIDPYRRPDRLAKMIGIAYEAHYIPPAMSARKFLQFAATARGQSETSVEQTSDLFGLTSFQDRETGTYSAGMRKRVALAQAFIGDPALLVLDEPFTNLDPEGRMLLVRLLAARSDRGLTTLVSTHLAETAIAPTHIAFLVNGRLEAAGPTAELAERYDARSVALAVPDLLEAAQVLVRNGVPSVALEGDHLVVRGNAATIQATIDALERSGRTPSQVSVSYDIWAIYRSILLGLGDGKVPASTGS